MEALIVLVVLCLVGGIILLIVNAVAAIACRNAVVKLSERLERLECKGAFRPAEPRASAPPPKPEAPPLREERPPAPKPAAAPLPAPKPEAVRATPEEQKAAVLAAAIRSIPASVPKVAAAAAPPAPAPALREQKAFPEPEPSEFERCAAEALRKIWSWIVVGEEFRPRKVAVEYAVATVWLVRSAVLLLLIGIGFFVKYSHDNNLVSPQVRIAGVVLLGLGIVAFGCRLVKSERYRLLGFGLSGVGVVTLYFAIFAAASIYKFLPVPAAFPLMVLITVFGALLALRQNSLLVALIAVIGGYATPVLLSTGSKHLPELFSYLVLMGAGSLFLAFYRNWRLLNFIAFLLNYVIFTGAAYRFFKPELRTDYWHVAGFASALFVLFSILPLLYSLVHRRKVTLLEILLFIANAGLYLLIAVRATLLAFPESRYAAGITLFAALVFAAEFLFCVKFRVRDRNLYLCLLAFCSFVVALTFPLLLSGHWITAAWAIQAAAMLYLGTHSGSRFLSVLSFILYAVAGVHAVVMLGNGFDGPATYWEGLLDRFVSLGSCSLAFIAGCLIMKRSGGGSRPEVVGENEPEPLGARQAAGIGSVFLWAAAIFIFVLLRIEIAKLPVFAPVLRVALCSVLYLGTLGFMLYRDRFCKGSTVRGWMAAGMVAAVADLVRLTLSGPVADYPVDCGFRIAAFFCFSAGLALIARALFGRHVKESLAGFFGAAGGVLWFVYSSAELYRGLSLYMPEFALGGLSVLWAVYALALLVGGIRFRLKPVRLCGLGLFGVVALKAIFFDLARLPSLYRVLAFLAMGVLFFVGAFAYMRMEQLFRPPQDEKEKEQ